MPRVGPRKLAAAESTDVLNRLAYACVLFGVPLTTCNGLRITSSMTFGDPLLLMGGLLLGMAWLRHGGPRGAIPRWLVVAPAMLMAAGLLAILPSDDTASLLPTIQFSVTLATMPLILMFAGATSARIKRLGDAWLLAVVVNSTVAVLDLLKVTRIGASLTFRDFVEGADRSAGLTLHPNHLALVAAMALPVAISMLAANGTRRAAGLAALPFVLGGIAVSGSRGALLAGAGGVLLFFMLQARATRSWGGIFLTMAIVAAFAFLVFSPGASETFGVTGQRLATQGTADPERLSLYRAAIDAGIRDPVVGQGFTVILVSHDIYLQLLEAGGVLALGGFLLFSGGIMTHARELARVAPVDAAHLPTIAAAAGAGMGTWMLFGLTANALYDRYLYIPAGLVLAIGFVCRGDPRSSPVSR